MMKFFVVMGLAAFSVNAFAAAIPQDKLSDYVNAVTIALNQHPLTCAFTPEASFSAGSLSAAIAQSTSAEINDSGAQPILSFYASGGQVKVTFEVTTSADYKSIVLVDFIQQECTDQMVNVGTLQNPKIVTQPVCKTTYTAVCK